MKNTRIKASSLRTAMVIFLLMIGGLSIGGFYYAQGWLTDLAAKSQPASVDNDISASAPQELSQANKTAAIKAAGVTVPTVSYQDLIIQDLNSYALSTDIKINASEASQPPAAMTATALINGVQSKYITVKVASPVPYSSLIKFIKAVETNLPKMRLTGISLSRVQGSDDSVMVEPIIIEVYTR